MLESAQEQKVSLTYHFYFSSPNPLSLASLVQREVSRHVTEGLFPSFAYLSSNVRTFDTWRKRGARKTVQWTVFRQRQAGKPWVVDDELTSSDKTLGCLRGAPPHIKPTSKNKKSPAKAETAIVYYSLKNRIKPTLTQVVLDALPDCKDAVQALGQLVSLNWTHYCAYICDLSNS